MAGRNHSGSEEARAGTAAGGQGTIVPSSPGGQLFGASSLPGMGAGATKSVTGMVAVALFIKSVQIGSAASAPDRFNLLGPSKPTQTTASKSGV
jgi:hypothetical protein